MNCTNQKAKEEKILARAMLTFSKTRDVTLNPKGIRILSKEEK